MRNLPIGVQDFEILRRENYIYIDKTQLHYDLIKQGRVYFISRPRRFGKSLLISTLAAIFQAKKALFKDLWIGQSDYDWQEYPVIQLDMSKLDNQSRENLEAELKIQLEKIAARYKVKINATLSAGHSLDELISALSKINKVVVLVDEYDKPLLDQLNNPEVAKQNRDLLKHFYGILKAQDHNIRFVLLTGVTKFSKVSVFSGLNNLDDITFKTNFATLLGYTEQEITTTLEPWLTELAKEENTTTEKMLKKVRYWYNGYQFSKLAQRVYNPFSTLLLFKYKDFSVYWFETGTPTILLDLIEKQNFDMQELESLEVQEIAFSTYEIDDNQLLPLLYQTGYLTIKGYDPQFRYYQLGYPNFEVEHSFLTHLLERLSKVRMPKQQKELLALAKSLIQKDFDTFFTSFNRYLAAIPYDLHISSEHYYHSLFYLLMTLVGLTLQAEVHTSRGRIDAVIDFEDTIYIFEFKFNQSALAAMEQIKARNYPEKYKGTNKKLMLIGANFEQSARNINEWLIETAS